MSPRKLILTVAGFMVAMLSHPMSPAATADESPLFASIEQLFLQYNRDGGTQVGDQVGDTADTTYSSSPRLTVGTINSDGLGGLFRVWQFDHLYPTLAGEGYLSVESESYDFEIFKRYYHGDATAFDLSFGLRYLDFDEILFDESLGIPNLGRNTVSGLGGYLGAQVSHQLGQGVLSFSGRKSLLAADKSIVDSNDFPFEVQDSNFSITEIAVRYHVEQKIKKGNLLLGVGVEWQQWNNFSSGYDLGDDTPTDFRGTGADVGFFGFGWSVGYEF